ncbi:leucine-rich repeat transmembrane neuronal protein 4-like [Sitodiplosis mosellana]|uniref:leucine-rich repeat transmembrane neuronal protein 4-like n=1 Tax=Sitodiplosis mosellana TaxID=263140 RepID=UPI002443B93C|nr:leucine-rich repeat transmembrane neuronal protein 4-like [Sitodiplosis mosellana]
MIIHGNVILSNGQRIPSILQCFSFYSDLPPFTLIKFFDVFKSLHTLNISDVELETLQTTVFKEASNLSDLNASQNRLKELPSHLSLAFSDAKNIEFLDLSQNNLIELNGLLFTDLINLKTLNLSHNSIKQFYNFRTGNLLTIDLSYNHLTSLNDDTFRRTIELKHLNLSFNSIGNLKVETFAYMPNLEYLNLRRTNMSSICGFRNVLFPQLELLAISDNAFICSYLHHFMATINWEKLHLHLAPYSAKTGLENIRGISCSNIFYEPTSSEITNEMPNENKSLENVLKETLLKLNPKSNDDLFSKIVLASMLVIIAVYVSLFIILNRDRICNQFKRSHSSNECELSISYKKERDETLIK